MTAPPSGSYHATNWSSRRSSEDADALGSPRGLSAPAQGARRKDEGGHRDRPPCRPRLGASLGDADCACTRLTATGQAASRVLLRHEVWPSSISPLCVQFAHPAGAGRETPARQLVLLGAVRGGGRHFVRGYRPPTRQRAPKLRELLGLAVLGDADGAGSRLSPAPRSRMGGRRALV